MLRKPDASQAPAVGESSGPSIIVKAEIGGAEQKAVIATGSGVNLMSKETANQYPVPMQKYEGTVYHAEGKQIRLLGKKTLPVCMGGRFVSDADFLVAPMLPVDVILGTSFLKSNQCSIDFQSGQLFTGKTESTAVRFDCVFKTQVTTNAIDHGPNEILVLTGYEGGFIEARSLSEWKVEPYKTRSMNVIIADGEGKLRDESFFISEATVPIRRPILLGVPVRSIRAMMRGGPTLCYRVRIGRIFNSQRGLW